MPVASTGSHDRWLGESWSRSAARSARAPARIASTCSRCVMPSSVRLAEDDGLLADAQDECPGEPALPRLRDGDGDPRAGPITPACAEPANTTDGILAMSPTEIL